MWDCNLLIQKRFCPNAQFELSVSTGGPMQKTSLKSPVYMEMNTEEPKCLCLKLC